MKTTTIFALALGAAALTACNQGAQEEVADNIEANAEMNADATREAGEEAADATRNGADADGNSAN